MKFSEQWLREWVKSPATAQQWADQLTMGGVEVETIIPLGTHLENVRIGLVQNVTRHPDADRLNVCQVDVGDAAPLTIVCGASNVRANLKVAVALVGAVLPGNFAIKRAKIRGIESSGMICSSSELGLAESSDGILELAQDAPVGTAYAEYLGLPDQLLDVSLTPNRGDCLSVLGLARELSALGQSQLTLPTQTETPATIQDTLAVKLLAPQDCPRYVGRAIRGIRADAITPLWMQERLRRTGIRSIHPVVDVMNYVMVELGQPLHAFDLSTIHQEIHVRHSQSGEQATLLDGQTVTLPEAALVIADAEKILALAGIMGGASSAVSNTTRDIFIESAFFTPEAISTTLRRLPIQSDAAHRFERGVDPQLAMRAMQRASELVLSIAGGTAGPIIENTSQENLPASTKILLRAKRIPRILGLELPATDIAALLKRIYLEVQPVAEGWEVTIPSYRFDLRIEVDLIEEIARLYGYNNIPSHALQAPLTMQATSETELNSTRIRAFLVDQGYQEAINYSFIDPKLAALLHPEQTLLSLSNPISADLSVMRPSLWGGLLQTALFNLNRQQPRVRLFEIGTCFFAEQDPINQLPQQLPRLAGITMGAVTPEQWSAPKRHFDFFDLKGDLENLFALTQDRGFEFKASSHPALHPGRSTAIYRAGKLIGYMGELHPELQQKLAFPLAPYLFELSLNELLPLQLPRYATPSKFPSIRRDLAFILKDAISYQEVADKVYVFAGEALQNVQLFDIYQGQGIAPGQKSIAMGLTFQLTSRTLIDQEVDEAVQAVVTGLMKDFQATLRE